MKTKLLFFNGKGKSFFLSLMLVPIYFFCNVHNAVCQSDTVHIDPTYTGGQNNGSLAHPYVHWTNIPGYPDGLKDHTFYGQRRGTKDTIRGPITIHHNNALTLGVYGSGTDYAHLHNTLVADSNTFNIYASNHITVDGYHLTATYGYTSGVFITDDYRDSTSTFVGNNIRVTNCFIEKFYTAIFVFKFVKNPFDTLLIDHVKVHNVYSDGIYIQLSPTIPFHNLEINNCYIDSVNMGYNINGGDEGVNPGDGIQMVNQVFDWKIRNTTIDRRNSSNKFCIIFADPSHYDIPGICTGLIENCTIYVPNVGFGGSAMYLDALDSVVVRNNHVYSSLGQSNMMYTRHNTKVRCYYNTFSKMVNGQPSSGFDIGSGPNKFHNNTFYGLGTAFITNTGFSSEVVNNIFSNVGTVYQFPVGSSPDYNLYFKSNTGNNTEPHSIYDLDPLFVDSTNRDFRLQLGSPAINKGLNLGYTSDIVGTPLPQGEGFDIGAYEFNFSDSIPPTTPTGLVVSNISYTGFVLNWNPSTDNIGISKYEVYKNGVLAATVTGTSAIITGLTQGVTYSMTVKAKDLNGNASPASKTIKVTTKASSDTRAPSKPTGLIASNISDSMFELSWSASTDNVGVTEYDVYQNGSLVAIVAGTSTTITGLSPNMTYTITVKARDLVGNTSDAGTLLVTTLALCTDGDIWNNTSFTNQTGTFTAECDVTPQGGDVIATLALSDGPAPVNSFSSLACIVAFFGDGTIVVRDDGIYNSVTPYSYISGVTYHIKMVVNAMTMLYDVYIKKAGTSDETIIASQYRFRAQATQLNNLSEQSSTCHLAINNFSILTTTDVIVPGTPKGLSARNIICTGFTLSWKPSIDNKKVTGYDVFKNDTLYTSVIGASANIIGLSPSTTYKFTVRAKDGSGNVSAFSVPLMVSTPRDNEDPSVPAGLFSNNLTETSLVLIWTASTDNVAVKEYDIYKNNALYSSVTGNSANISGLTAGTTYSLTVKAKDAAGNVSHGSNALLVSTLDLQAPSVPNGLSYSGLTSRELTLSWTASTDNVRVTGYDIYKNGVLIANTFGTSLCIFDLVPATTYSFTVKAKDKAGNVSASSSALFVTTPKFKSASVDMNNSGKVIPILIYPNPTDNIINIQLSEHSIFKITDISGKLLFNRPFEKGMYSIPLNLQPGLYIIQVFVENKSVYSSKLIVK